ncbi:serine/threonine-protein kinase [Niveispirillum sp. BGYR6]|uniref:serine/threonine-protein kinase n=1 Tax=Niveispirillum sp. BGYR6 TaxID=2971249 RepID=UPI0022B954EE|nr:serine/threonine-protein kinase [Niveispirillum sp. BGYR6]MDG5493428.1 serine/threonine-protein kinase [Niveispirillum sp. BGYR6]
MNHAMLAARPPADPIPEAPDEVTSLLMSAPVEPDEETSLLLAAEPEAPEELTRFVQGETAQPVEPVEFTAIRAAPGPLAKAATREVVENQLAGLIGAIRAEAKRTGLAEIETLDLLRTARGVLERYIAKATDGRDDDPAPTPPPDSSGWSLAPGAVMLNSFKVRTLLARGGMGEIYRVRHRDLKTDHAIKVIIPAYRDDPRIVGMFHAEGRLLRRVRHEAVVECAGLFRDNDGRSMLLLEYVDGPSLSQLIRRGPLRLSALEALLRRLAAGLSAIHAAGLVHRDVSPDNILLPDDNPAAAKIIDFGVAAELRGGVTPRDGLDFAGKFSFASPEQLGLHGGTIGIASDIYSLGLVIAAAARGEKLPMGQTPDQAADARRSVPPLDAVPDRLRPIIRAMLQPDPKQRPTDLSALLRGLDAPGATKGGGLLSRIGSLFGKGRG